ncbi:hypothetical protein OsJ_33229 [Oryza sativa Japonica Group]|uniref:Uncharacterized protein n=1 Tax=Oryza sativa subsp. japonica TaxID=39947 RepID=B9G9S4_ORYSJ|nr:hypothetical protein OsJ_33229 [Oryza sativa Japonica Group]
MLEKEGKLIMSREDEEIMAWFERTTRDAADVQRETLRRILAENAGVEYLRELGLAGLTDAGSFRARVPVVTHADLDPYIQRVADGDASPVLTAKPVTAISLSSRTNGHGVLLALQLRTTQGKRKRLLFNDDLLRSSIRFFHASYAFTNRAFPVEDGRVLQFMYGSRHETTKGGLTATTVMTNLLRSEEFTASMAARSRPRLPSCSPSEVVFSPDFDESLYCHLLCGLLLAGEVRAVSASFAHSIVVALQALERVWRELCADIRRGAASPARVTTPAVRRAVAPILAAPNPGARRRAGAPATMTGSMEHYVKKLRHYAGGVPLVSGNYASSEGVIGINAEQHASPESVVFTVLPDAAYFEFIPLKPPCTDAAADDDNPAAAGSSCYVDADDANPVGLTDVVVGEHYEVVMTTFTGLYRYRLGDVVKVAGFHHATPKLRFVCRRSLILSINVDKNSEHDLQLAVDSAAKILACDGENHKQLEIADYTSHADTSSDPGHYVVFWELNGGGEEDGGGVLQRCCDEMDRAFGADAGYAQSRKTCAIGALELRVLRRGAFQEVLRHYVAGGSSAGQFKMPRCVAPSNAGVLRVLKDNTINIFFSTAYDYD